MKRIVLIVLIILLAISTKAQINFDAPFDYFLGARITSVEVGDVNNDGLNDAIAISEYAYLDEDKYQVFVFIQNQHGQLNDPIQYSFADSANGDAFLKIGDFNNDNLNDIVVGSGFYINIFFQNENGTLSDCQIYYSGGGIRSLEVGDFNNDGLQDVVAGHYADFIKVFYQSTVNDFDTVSFPIITRGDQEIEAGDMNGDGLTDIVFMGGTAAAVAVFYQDSIVGIDSIYKPYYFNVGDYGLINGIGVGDLNNDGRDDLALSAGGNTGYIGVIYQNAEGELNPPIQFNAYDVPTPVEIADLNCDGQNEIIVGHNGWGNISVYEVGSSGTFNSNYMLFPACYYVGPYGLAVGDYNNDSRMDVLTTDGGTRVKFLYNSSSPDTLISSDTTVNYVTYIIDTAITHSDFENISIVETINECIIKTTYQYEYADYQIYRNIMGDSLVSNSFELCGNYITDTFVTDFYINRYDWVDDTLIEILAIDTLYENEVIVDYFDVMDTLSVIEETFSDNLTLTETYTSNDTTYYITDSLSIEALFQVSTLQGDFYHIIDGIKCGNYTIDTVFIQDSILYDTTYLQADTTLILRTIKAYYNGQEITDLEEDIFIYPNPTMGIIKIRTTNLSMIEVLNMEGVVFYRKELNVNTFEYTLNLSQFDKGLYILRMTKNGHFRYRKIIKS